MGYKELEPAEKSLMGRCSVSKTKRRENLNVPRHPPKKPREFTVSGDVMTGTLVVDGGHVVSQIRVTRKK